MEHTTIHKINNKDLLYSIGNYIPYLVMTYAEKNLKNIYYIYINIYYKYIYI